MKKTIITLVVAVVLVISTAFTAMAADGINANEQTLYNKFEAFINSWVNEHAVDAADKDAANEYLSQAYSALLQVDLSAEACNELAAAIDQIEALAKERGWKTDADAWANKEEILKIVNGVANKYGMNVTLDSSNHYATVTITTPSGQTTPGGSTKPAVNQTGVDMTATIIVVIALLAVFAVGIVVSRKKFAAR